MRLIHTSRYQRYGLCALFDTIEAYLVGNQLIHRRPSPHENQITVVDNVAPVLECASTVVNIGHSTGANWLFVWELDGGDDVGLALIPVRELSLATAELGPASSAILR